MSDCNHDRTRLVVRARERTETLGTTQLVECIDCEDRWYE